MPENNSPMQGMIPAFMNTPQYQQQMQGLAMQLRQQEDGMKRTKKFLKAYEDIQLNQPMPQQQPAFMQPPGGQVQAQNQQLAASVAPEAGEQGPTSFTQLAGGMGGQMDMEDSSGPIPSAEPSSANEEVVPGSPGDPGLARRGKLEASNPKRQAHRKTLDEVGRLNAKNAAFDKVVKDTSWQGMSSWIDELKDWLYKAKREVKIGKNTEASKTEMKVLQRTVNNVQADLKNAKKIDMEIAQKLKKIASSMPNKAMGLGAAFGGSLMSDAYAADASENGPEMSAGRTVDQGAPGKNDNPRTSAAHQAFLELQTKTGNYMVNRRPGARGQEPIEYSAGEDVQRAQ